jgi:hypothetical protein
MFCTLVEQLIAKNCLFFLMNRKSESKIEGNKEKRKKGRVNTALWLIPDPLQWPTATTAK